MKMFASLMILFGCLVMTNGVDAARKLSFGGDTITQKIGVMPVKFVGLWIKPGTSCSKQFDGLRAPYALIVRVVIADDKRGHRLAYSTSVNHTTLARRDLKADGVGRRSQFVRVDDPAIYKRRSQTVRITNTGEEPLFVEAVFILSDYSGALQRSFSDDDFLLSFLVVGASPDHPSLARLPEFKTAPGITRAISTELYYAIPDPKGVENSVDNFKAAAEKLGWPMVASVVSWWAGTPPEVKHRRDFQQVCYSETDSIDEGDDLKRLLSKRWDIRYGWTTPNIWSSTPWQTLNNPELNALRKERLGQRMPYITRTLGKGVLAYIAENEPMYWAGDFPDEKYPVKRTGLQADFNPMTVASAASDNITLDPTDGLDAGERQWLYENLGRYIETATRLLKRHAKGKPVYTHAQVDEQFPLKYAERFRPNVELSAAKGLPSGIEMLWTTDMNALQRIREWGAWGLINREECDQRPMTQHIAMANATYAMGASILNSYNWHALRPEDAKEYFNAFTQTVGQSSNSKAIPADPSGEWISAKTIDWDFETPVDCPWATGAMLYLRNKHQRLEPITLTATDTKTRTVIGFSRAVLAAGYTGWVRLPFDSLTDADQQAQIHLTLKAPSGIEVITTNANPVTKWEMNVVEERLRSQIIQSLARQ